MLDLLGFQLICTHATSEMWGGANYAAKSVFAGEHDCQHSCGVVVVGGVFSAEAQSVVIIVNFPEKRARSEHNPTKIMFMVRIIVLGEIIKFRNGAE